MEDVALPPRLVVGGHEFVEVHAFILVDEPARRQAGKAIGSRRREQSLGAGDLPEEGYHATDHRLGRVAFVLLAVLLRKQVRGALAGIHGAGLLRFQNRPTQSLHNTQPESAAQRGWSLCMYRHGPRLPQQRDEKDIEGEKSKREKERRCEGAARAAHGGHDVDEDHRGLAEELDETVGGALGRRLGDLGRVLHADGHGVTRKKPRTMAETQSRGKLVPIASPRSPGAPKAMPMSRKGLRRLRLSDMGGRTTAPRTPATSMRAPRVPASSGPMPRGRTMASIQVATPLKMPMPTKEIAR